MPLSFVLEFQQVGMSQTIPFICPKRNILHIFKHIGTLDCKPIDTPLPIGQMFTKKYSTKKYIKHI
jgi:hypothetical protein